MKKIDLGQKITILANVGVIAGIVFLGIELQQNNALIASQTRFNRLSAATGTNTLVADNADLAEIIAKANKSEELTDGETIRLYFYNLRALSNMQWTFREVPEANIPINVWRRIHDNNLHRRNFWERERQTFSDDFVQFIDNNVVNR